jgi:hypothetical protein
MGRWYLAAGPFFFSVVLGSADLPRDPLLKYQNSQIAAGAKSTSRVLFLGSE